MKVPNRGHSSCYHSIPMSWRAAVDALGFDDVVAVVAAAAAVVAVVVAAAAVAVVGGISDWQHSQGETQLTSLGNRSLY